jgi:hypothetical protein
MCETRQKQTPLNSSAQIVMLIDGKELTCHQVSLTTADAFPAQQQRRP